MKNFLWVLPLLLLLGCEKSEIIPFAEAKTVNIDTKPVEGRLDAEEDERLNLKFTARIQYRLSEASPWRDSVNKEIDGLSGIQYHLDSDLQYRMVLEVEKPFDLKGTFKARLVTRSDGVTLPPDSTKGTIIFGPHQGCVEDQGNRCAPLSVEDVGLVELRMDTELTVATTFGAFLLRAFTMRPEPMVRPSITYKDEVIPCGGSIKKKGFWIFAKRIRGDGSYTDTISLCVTKPDGKRKCAKFNDFDIKTRASKKGRYVFTVWNERFLKTSCEVTVR